MTRVVIELSESDVRNADELTEHLNMRSKADTVSTALTLTREIVKTAGQGGEVIVKNDRGEASKLKLAAIFG